MKRTLVVLIFIFSFIYSKGQNNQASFSFGLDYRQYPIDVENVPRGGYSSNAIPDEGNFWYPVSIHAKYNYPLQKNWYLSMAVYGRYNHNHYLQGINLSTPTAPRRAAKKKLKFDTFIDVEKRFPVSKTKHRYFTVTAGIGFTNINTYYNVFVQDTLPGGGITQGYQYVGSNTHFGPRLNLGYQLKQYRFSVDTYLIEGPDLTGLASLWLGFTLGYELPLNSGKKLIN